HTPFAGGLQALQEAHLHQQAVSPGERRPDLQIPALVSALTLKALAKRPEERFQTADEMKITMEDALFSIPAGSRDSGRPVFSTPATTRKREESPNLVRRSAPTRGDIIFGVVSLIVVLLFISLRAGFFQSTQLFGIAFAFLIFAVIAM